MNIGNALYSTELWAYVGNIFLVHLLYNLNTMFPEPSLRNEQSVTEVVVLFINWSGWLQYTRIRGSRFAT